MYAYPPSRLHAANEVAQWKILIVDEDSQRLINNVVKEDDILNLNITSMRPPLLWSHRVLTLPDIERLEDRRQSIRDMDAVYIISPKPHIVDCMMAEFEQRRYRGFFLIWTTCEKPADLELRA